MQNNSAITGRRLSDPDFQGSVVHKSLLAVVALCGLCGVFALHDMWVWTHPSLPKYFLIDGIERPHQVTALDSPILDDTELLQWTVKFVLAPYNVDYHNYPIELNTAGRAFTQNGWNSFAKSYIQGGNFEELKRARLLCYAQAQRAAVIHETSLLGGRLVYTVQFPMVQTCENVNQSSSQNLIMTATVTRTGDLNYPDGLAIDQLVAKPY